MARSRKVRHGIFPIAREGWRFILPFLALLAIFAVAGFMKTTLFFALVALSVAAFFRDPERRVPRRPGLVLSPADGKVTAIDEVEIEVGDGSTQRMRCVSIFLSIFNAHINRAPTYGTIVSVKYNPGKFINAMNDKSSDDNENNMIWMRSGQTPLGVKQIAGLIARRIVCHCQPGEHVLAGQRIGLIRFGSRTNAYFPLDAVVRAKIGQKVKAGQTILAEMPRNANEPAEDEQ